jgi:hypothetical protein
VGIVIGMDEAGLGPNLGPLVITATVWEVPGNPRDADFWTAFEGFVTPDPPLNDSQLQIADSKHVYSPTRGFDHLETGVLAACGLLGWMPNSFRDLTQRLTCLTAGDLATEPWFADRDASLPSAVRAEHVTRLAAAWVERCHATGVRLRAIRSDVVLTQRFNQLTRRLDNKGAALSQLSLQLLRQVWSPVETERTLVLADKHGGRNRYHDLLADVADGEFIFSLEEAADRSRYRIGATELAFQTRSEQHLPVALASMVCKYLREVAMKLFNAFWQEHVPGLKPTAGYPVDARRFRDEIEPARRRLQIADDVLWRER